VALRVNDGAQTEQLPLGPEHVRQFCEQLTQTFTVALVAFMN